MNAQHINLVITTPVWLGLFDIKQWRSVKTLVIGGEACPKALAERWAQGRALYNAYGPSETTVIATLGRYQSAQSNLHIGKPIANTQAIILDNRMRPVPLGAIGELYLSGAGLARGYVNDPIKTDQQFITVSQNIDGQHRKRLYKTGDLVKRLEDGNLMFIGRGDNQIKIRGLRIELDEIANLLCEHPKVNQAVVIARGEQQHKHLLAFVVTNSQDSDFNENLRHWLTERCPQHQLPAAIQLLDKLPQTSSGKIDTRVLPEVDIKQQHLKPYQGPRNSTEQLMSEIWADVLQLEKVSINDNFFSLGGDSIRAMQLAQVLQQHKLNISVKTLFDHPTIQALAQYSQSSTVSNNETQAPLSLLDKNFDKSGYINDHIEDAYPASALQTRMLNASAQTTDKQQQAGQYQPQLLVSIRHIELNPIHIEQTLNYLVNRQPSYRSHFVTGKDGQYIQKVAKKVTVNLTLLENITDQQLIAQDLDHPIVKQLIDPKSPNQAHGLRFVLVKHQKQHHTLMLSAHHSLLDGTAMEQLINDVATLYPQAVQNRLPKVQSQPNIYKQKLALELEARTCSKQQHTWQQLLSHYQPMPPLKPIDPTQQSTSNQLVFELPPPLTKALQAQAKTAEVPIKTLLLRAYLIALGQQLNTNTVTVELVCNGRSERLSDPQSGVGLFWNLLPLSIRLTQAQDIAINALAKQLMIIDSHAQFPLDALHSMTGKQKTDSEQLSYAAFNYVHHHQQPHKQMSNSPAKFELSHHSDRFDHAIKIAIRANLDQDTIMVNLEFDRRYIDLKQAEKIKKRFIDNLKLPT